MSFLKIFICKLKFSTYSNISMWNAELSYYWSHGKKLHFEMTALGLTFKLLRAVFCFKTAPVPVSQWDTTYA